MPCASGTTFTHEGELFTKVLEFTHNKTGRGGPRFTKVVNLRTGSIYEKTFSGGERVAISA